MKLKDWLTELPYTLLSGSTEEEVREVVYDSRKAGPETVFVCMRGANVDSHDFAGDAVKKGCRVIVAEHPVEVPGDVTVIRVENGRNALALLSAARFDWPLRKMTSIGITGTKGKTTTTYMLKAILEAAGHKTGLIGTNGCVIGEEHFETKNTTPESYILEEYFARMVEAGCEYMVMEVSSQSYLMHRVDGLFYDYSAFLNISNDHIGPNEHKDFQEYLFYKKELLRNSRRALVNKDDPHFEEIIRDSRAAISTFSLEGEADFMADSIQYIRDKDFVGLEFLTHGLLEDRIRVSIPGKFNVANALAAAGIASFLHIPPKTIGHALEHFSVNGRMEIAHRSAKCTVIVDYAHNAVSMESLLKTLRDYHPKRLVCVFGCGGNRARDRRFDMGEIGGRLADLCILTADNSRFEKVEDILADIRTGISRTEGKYIEIPDRREAIYYSLAHAEEGDMIAIIGKGHEDYQEIMGVRHHFLDREVVEEAVRELGEENV